MIVVADIETPRLHYVLNYIFNHRLGIGYELHQLSEYSGQQPAVFYTSQPADNQFLVPTSGLLAETDVWQFTPDLTFDNETPIIFADHSNCTFKFDVFAAIFWFLSRYEEYLPFLTDEHNRFPSSESFAVRNGLLETPVVDLWLQLFRNKLQKAFPNVICKAESFEFLPTIDIDSPWSYLHKGVFRNLGGAFRDLCKADFRAIITRLLVLLRLKPDPFFTFNYINHLHQGLNLHYFMLVSNRGAYDKSIKPTNRAFKRFVKHLSATHTVGLHPSYQASDNEQKFATELSDIERITSQKCTQSRQHFLRVILPKYYQMLENNGITNDFSFGYADKVGFRAGTSRPFPFFDLVQNKQLNVMLTPLVAMDVTLRNYQKLTPQQASVVLEQLLSTIKKTNGLFTTLWHNQHFCQTNKWSEWDNVYLKMLDKVKG